MLQESVGGSRKVEVHCGWCQCIERPSVLEYCWLRGRRHSCGP